jgi:hypothetical protein
MTDASDQAWRVAFHLYVLSECEACEELAVDIERTMQLNPNLRFPIKRIKLKRRSDLSRYGLKQISGLPLSLIFVDGILRMGWEGSIAGTDDSQRGITMRKNLESVAALLGELPTVALPAPQSDMRQQ